MRFKIDRAIFETFPRLHIGVVKAGGVDNRGDCQDIAKKIEQIHEEIRERFDLQTLAEYPAIQNWRNAYSLFGARPKKHRSSVENLYRMILEGKTLRPVNKLVDIYNYVSLLHMVPVGGDDLAFVEGDILLKFAGGDEPFFPLGSDESQTARRGEVIYADAKEVLCRRWNWRESEKTKMTANTQDVLLVCEGLPPVSVQDMERVVEDLARLVKHCCGGETIQEILSSSKSIWDL